MRQKSRPGTSWTRSLHFRFCKGRETSFPFGTSSRQEPQDVEKAEPPAAAEEAEAAEDDDDDDDDDEPEDFMIMPEGSEGLSILLSWCAASVFLTFQGTLDRILWGLSLPVYAPLYFTLPEPQLWGQCAVHACPLGP